MSGSIQNANLALLPITKHQHLTLSKDNVRYVFVTNQSIRHTIQMAYQIMVTHSQDCCRPRRRRSCGLALEPGCFPECSCVLFKGDRKFFVKKSSNTCVVWGVLYLLSTLFSPWRGGWSSIAVALTLLLKEEIVCTARSGIVSRYKNRTGSLHHENFRTIV